MFLEKQSLFLIFKNEQSARFSGIYDSGYSSSSTLQAQFKNMSELYLCKYDKKYKKNIKKNNPLLKIVRYLYL